MVVISKGIYEGVVPVEGVRYASPNHMSGWWLTTDEYDGDINSLKTVHFKHVVEHRPELAIYMALPVGYRFLLGGESEHVWFDKNVASESYNKPLKALASLAGTVTRRLCHSAPNFSLRVTAP